MLNKKLLLAGLIMLGFTACNNDEDCGCDPAPANLVEAQVMGNINVKNSRVNGNLWTYDNIGIMVLDAPSSDMATVYKNVGYTTESNSTSAIFLPITQKDAIFFKKDNEIVTFAAYAPYIKTDPTVLPGNNGVLSVDTRSKNNNDDGQTSINYLYASGVKASKQDPIVSFSGEHAFKHCMSKMVITFRASIADGFTGDEIFLSTSRYQLGGLKLDGKFDVTSGVVTATGAIVPDWDFTNCIHINSPIEKERTYTMLLLPQENGAGSKMTVSITVNNQTYKNDKIITANLKPGMAYHYTIILKKNGLEVSGSTIDDWVDVDNKEGGAISE